MNAQGRRHSGSGHGPRRLIVTADDFGLSPGTNAAIKDAAQRGGITTATLMVQGPAAAEAAAIARELVDFPVGLHFNLTLGQPCAQPEAVPSLVRQDGRFFDRATFEKRVLTGRIAGRDVARELEAQIEQFHALGLSLAHMDSHEHVHLYPPVFGVQAKRCRQAGVALRMPWLGSDKPYRSATLKGRLRRAAVRALVSFQARRSAARVCVTRAFCSVFDLPGEPDQADLAAYRQLLGAQAREPVELMTHPAYPDALHRQLTRISSVSENDATLLTQPAFVEMLAELGYTRVAYPDVVAG